MPAVRLADVARDAGVSLATASRVLNGSTRTPGKEVAERVRASASRLGYVTNLQAQALARSRTDLVGLVVHDIADPYFGTLSRAIQRVAFASRSQVLLTQTDRDVSTELRAVRSLIAQRVDAIILLGSRRYGDGPDGEILTLLRGYVSHGGRIVAIGQDLGIGSTILVDDAGASRDLATALVAAGHRRFVVAAARADIPSVASRTEGFLDGLEAAGLTAELSVPATLDRDGGHALADAVADHLGTTSGVAGALCVFAPADVMAFGVLCQLRRRGIDVPERAAVVGFGGVPTVLDVRPTLTSLDLPLEEMADRAITWVLDPEPDHAGGALWHVPGVVALRESTALTGSDGGPRRSA